MIANGVALRVPVTVETPGENLGDGPTYDEPMTVLASVQQDRVIKRDVAGETVTDPLILLVGRDVIVPVGSRVAVDGETSVVMSSKPVRGPFGVVVHREVRAL